MCADRIVETERFTYRLRPGKHAEAVLEAEWHRCRWLWNEAGHQEKSGCKPTLCRLSKLLTRARSSCGWMWARSQNAQQQTLRTYARGLNDSYKVKGRGKPVTKTRKHCEPSLEYTTNGFVVRDGRLELAKCPPIAVVWSRELPSQPTTVNVYRDNLRHWYASFVVTREREVLPDFDTGIGIDRGVKTTAVTTDSAYDLPHRQRRRAAHGELGAADHGPPVPTRHDAVQTV